MTTEEYKNRYRAKGPARPGPSRWRGRRRTRAGARINALFIAPVPLVFRAFGSDPAGLFLNLLAFGTLILAAWMTREGLRAEDAFEARLNARRPALPRKLLGAGLTGLGLGFAGLTGGDFVAPILFAILGVGLHVLSFGIDPMADKAAPGLDRVQSDRIARAVDEASSYIAEMQAMVATLKDRALARKLDDFAATARRMFDRVEADPRELSGARRWLGVYLLGARDATEKYAALAERGGNAKARADYVALLDDLQTGFARRTETMLLDDRSDLDVEIEVLRERLAREDLSKQSDG